MNDICLAWMRERATLLPELALECVPNQLLVGENALEFLRSKSHFRKPSSIRIGTGSSATISRIDLNMKGVPSSMSRDLIHANPGSSERFEIAEPNDNPAALRNPFSHKTSVSPAGP
jgi:hypothetical protein